MAEVINIKDPATGGIIQLYDSEISEFTDWKTGVNNLTEVQETGGLAVSGNRIRELLGKHLQKPFITYESKDDNKVYFFSSEEAKARWLQHKDEDNNEAYQSLVLYSMTKPNDYKIELDSEFLSSSSSQRYVAVGDSTQSGTRIAYKWDVKLGDASEPDNLLVTYEITNPSGKVQKLAESKNYGDREDVSNPLDLYNNLESGVNQVDILFSAQTTGAKRSLRIYITMVEFNLQSTFQFYNKVDVGDSFVLPITLDRNIVSQNASIFVNIDGNYASINGQNAGLPFTVNAGDTERTKQLSISNEEDPETGTRPYRGSTATEPVVHLMQVWAETRYNNVLFRSNLLLFTFEVKASSPIPNKFINIGTSYSSAIVTDILGAPVIYGTQYLPVTLSWGYYTDNQSYDTAIAVDWKIVQGESVTSVTTLKGEVGIKPSDLTFIPTTNSSTEPMYLKAYFGDEELLSIPMVIAEAVLNIVAPSGMALELNAYSKNNNTEDKNVWLTKGVAAAVTLSSAIKYDTTSGWYEHSLRLSGINEYAIIEYNAFDESNYTFEGSGRTIEFEFESEKVDDDNDVIMLIGTPNAARIEVTPNSATLYSNSNDTVIKTNFKANERVKLAFIFNPASNTSNNNLIYIVTNGILERGSVGGASFTLNDGSIKIGGARSGIKFYNMRIYNYALSYTTAYNNFVYDSDSKSTIVANNNIMKNGVVDYDACCAKIDTFLIEGELDALLSGRTDKAQSTTNASISRICPYDSTKNFRVTDAQIRKHGQSTLSYPITSMKFWLNKKFQPRNDNDIPRFVCEGQADLGLNKNRYKMKDTSIPANKFILQANYADSSGVHNGGLERLFQDTWFKAQVNGRYVLRTEPQLFTTISPSQKADYGLEHVWHDYFNTAFPYDIRIAPDSLPCVVFYKNGEGEITYLGQYVFMEDKKSDFNYGERSIYRADPADPFCLKTVNKKNDTDEMCIWDNDKVLRIEVLDINNIYTSYMQWTDSDGNDFDADIPEHTEEIVDPDTGEKTLSVIPRRYNWERYFEMIYPDPDDLEGDATKGTDKFGANSKFRRKAQPFIDWVKWLTDTRNNYTQMGYSSAQEAFEATAAEHLDLYMMAGYYIKMLRYGLVDSGERNVQIKTYNGMHFHYEPWDMDIAMGNRNDGGIAFNPPVDRNTRLGTGYAISGRGATTSNWLWDALEAWGEWSNTIVPQVAQALYDAGLTYDNSIDMFDGEYADKWSEMLYNESGYYKYIVRGGGSQLYLNWLQGARTMHRHWWLSSSMNYYDAKWGCGNFKNSRVDLFAGHEAVAGSDERIYIYPTSSTFFQMAVNQDNNLGTKSATRANPAWYNIGPVTFQPKTPTYIYGANFIEKLDLSVIADTLARITLGGSYDKVLGAPIKELNLGVPITSIDDNTYTGKLNIANPGTIENTSGDSDEKVYALTNLQTLNVRGQLGRSSDDSSAGNMYTTFTILRDTVDTRGDLTGVTNLYAMGSGIVNFQSSSQGNRFDNLELPAGVYSLNLNNTTWENISFWTSEGGLDGDTATFRRYNVNNNYDYFVPTGLTEVVFNGTTGKTLNSKNFIMTWIRGIVASLGANPTEEEIDAALAAKTLRMNDIDWGVNSIGAANLLTYDDLTLIAKIGTRELKGYLCLATAGTAPTSQQLTQLTQWFGNDIFTYSSSGLIVDYNLSETIISVSGDIITDSQGNIHLKEGHTAFLNATMFLLSNEQNAGVWTIRERVFDSQGNTQDTISGKIVKSCELDESDPRQIKLVAKNSEYEDYSIFVHSSLGNNDMVVYIDSTDYPSLYMDNTEKRARKEAGSFTLQAGSVDDNFSILIDLSQTLANAAEIQSIVWDIITPEGVTVNLDTTQNPTEYKAVDTRNILRYKRGNTRFDIRLASTLPNDDGEIYRYMLVARVYFTGKTQNISVPLLVMNDASPIVSNDGSALYLALNACYNGIYGEDANSFYRSTLLKLTGTLDFSSYTTLARTVVSTNKCIFYYTENISEIILDGCANLTSSYNTGGVIVNQMDLSMINGLRKLSIKNCSGLTADIDLTGNLEVREILSQGTTVNVILPVNPKVTTLALGTPTSISISEPVALTADGMSVESTANLNSIELVDVNASVKYGYRTFAKIFGL